MKRTLFHTGRKVDFYLERFRRSEDLKSWEQVPEIENFAKLPPQLICRRAKGAIFKKEWGF